MKRGLIPVVQAFAVIAAPRAGAATSARGFLYGTVKSENGKEYTGLLRWGREEACWGDFFNSAKEELPYIDRLPRDERSRRSRIRIFGTDVGYKWSNDYASRQFEARFGDIREIRPRHGERVDVTMKSGTTFAVDGGSNDIGAEIHVHDDAIGEVAIPWNRIESITFRAAPSGVDPGVSRLYGKLKAEDFTFEGWIQWDSEECLSTDVLNGTSDDGKLAIEMGKIASIARDGRKASEVTLKDGRTFRMSGTNDVDDSIRGIFVEDTRLGRVKVNWDSFDRLDFIEKSDSGPGYDDFKPSGPIRGTVTDEDGKTYRGRIIFDLDEEETWEFLNGNRYDVEYNIAFADIRSIEPRDRDSSRILLGNGAEVVLEDSQDVSDRNDGVLILAGDRDKDGTYLRWDEVRKIDFE